MKQMTVLAMLTTGLLAMAGCGADRMSEKGLSLPEGEADRDRDAFLYLHCHECHSIARVDLPRAELADPPFVGLGGTVTKVKTNGELVTAIINPSHKLAKGYPIEEVPIGGESMMPVYNGFMTVQELIDIVMFLQPHDEVFMSRYEYRAYP